MKHVEQRPALGDLPVVAARAVDALSHSVIDVLASVNGENNVAHFLVDKVDLVRIEEHTVRCYGEAEVLVVFLFLGTAVFNELFYNVPVHERFAAEEVNFKVLSSDRFFKQEVERLFARFKIHVHSAARAVVALRSKAVFAAEVAVV